MQLKKLVGKVHEVYSVIFVDAMRIIGDIILIDKNWEDYMTSTGYLKHFGYSKIYSSIILIDRDISSNYIGAFQLSIINISIIVNGGM